MTYYVLVTFGALSSLFTFMWMRNLQRAYESLERHASVTDENIAWLDEDIEDLNESVGVAHRNIADVVLHFNTPFDQVIFDADLTEEQEWEVRFIFAKARARMWGDPDQPQRIDLYPMYDGEAA